MFTEIDLGNKKFIDGYYEDNTLYWATEYIGEEGGSDSVYTDISILFQPGPVAPPIGTLGLVKTEKPYDSISFDGVNFTLKKRIEGYTSVGGGKYTREEFESFGNGSLDDLVNELFGTVTVIATIDFVDFVTEYDITASIDNIIKVVPGGAIEFVNDNKQPVPSSVSYMIGGHLLEKEV